MRVFENNEEKYVSTKAVITEFNDHNDKSYRFVAKGMVLGKETEVSGYFAKSLEREYQAGETVNISVKGSILDGSDESLTHPGIPCNYLWSISRGGADDLDQAQVDALKALLG